MASLQFELTRDGHLTMINLMSKIGFKDAYNPDFG